MSFRVLVLDDDERYLQLLEMMLESVGAHVVTSTMAGAFDYLIKSHNPDVVVMDIMMQELNGIEIAEQSRLNSDEDCIPIVFITAWTGSGNIQMPRKSVRLYKPFTARELVDTIDRILVDEAGH